MRSPEELTERFRGRGLKVTPQRQAVFRALHDATDHPTAESVYAAVSAEMPAISLRTVYQTLNDLASMGEIGTLDLGLGSTRFDPTVSDHHHLVCTSCGAVRDLFLDEVPLNVPAEQAGGFVLGSPEITWRGLCPACQHPASNPPHQPLIPREIHG